MTWHVISRVGADDSFVPEISSQNPRIEASFERPGDPWQVGNDVVERLSKATKARPSNMACDLLYLAMAIYAADLRIPRRFASDRWSREIALHFPVGDLAHWTRAVPQLVKTLNFLTGDRWNIQLRERATPYSAESDATELKCDSLCLFSGGLDSLVGAIDLLAAGKRVALVGHHGAGMTNTTQDAVLAELKNKYKDHIEAFMFYAQPPKRKQKDGEPSMRSRSFLFLALGIATASVFKTAPPIIVAENGLISLNVALTPSRICCSSTRTTHPHFVELYRALLKKLSIGVRLELPYRHKTKGEMLAEAMDKPALVACAPLTMSCSHPESGRYQKLNPKQHCGYCVPCIIRQAAMEHAKVADASYNIDVRVDPPNYKTQTGRDLRAFQMAIERFKGSSVGDSLASILSTGPLPSEEIAELAAVYRRGMDEVTTFFAKTQ